MNTAAVELDPRAIRAWVECRMVFIKLTDGACSDFSLLVFACSPTSIRLRPGSSRVVLEWAALRWEELDEDITVRGVVEGRFQLPLPVTLAA